jgi:hypothetical protein
MPAVTMIAPPTNHNASAGHVDHNGIASAPTQVQTRGDNVRRQPVGDLNAPNHSDVA